MKKYIKYLIIMFLFVFVANTTIVAQAATKINKSEKTIYVGDTYKLKITGTKKSVKWTSSKKSIATVDKNGKVTAKKSGKTTITAKVGKKKYKCVITVKKPSLNETKLTLNKGDKSTLKLNGTKAVSWKSSKKSIVSVSKKGKITAKKAGTATISVKAKNGKTYKCKVTVKKVENTTPTTPTTPTEPTTPVVHTHSYILFSNKDATCTEAGYKIYRCPECGDTYQDDFPALGHNYTSKVIAPTCTEQGYTVYTCTRDGSSYKDNYTNALEHNYVLTKTVEATCTTDGYKEYTCSRCGDSYKETIAKLGHNYVSEVIAPTCEEQGYTVYTCTICGDSYKDEYTDALGHDYGEGVIDIEATDYSLGYKIYTCKNCSETVRMPYALPHEVDLGNGQTTTIYGYWDMDMANEIFTMLNEYRLENGLKALESEESIDRYATIRAVELIYSYSHMRPNGKMPDAGENIGIGIGDAEDYMTAWKESTGHNANMLRESYKYGAVGVFVTARYQNTDASIIKNEFSNETPYFSIGNAAVQNFTY